MDERRRRDHLLSLRDELFTEWEECERELSRLRMLVERMESDQRIGLPVSDGYSDAKGHRLPQAEARIVAIYGELLKLEDKLNAEGPAA
jgi:hypothetical protein